MKEKKISKPVEKHSPKITKRIKEVHIATEE